VVKAPQRSPSQPLAAAAISPLKPAIAGIAVISGIVNVLALTAPLFMLQVYDRVLASRSVSTLIGLGVLAATLYAFQSLFDIIRSRILLRIGERFDHQLSGRVHDAVVGLPLEMPLPGDGLQPLRDLDNVRGFLSGPGPTAFFDLPWMPFYLAICFVFHSGSASRPSWARSSSYPSPFSPMCAPGDPPARPCNTACFATP
jgi:ABC-type protease/lipase transport system fused ATPase/permease subunit